MLRTFVILLAIAGAALLRGRAFASEPVAAMQLVPAQAHAVIVIPHLKLLSDQITQCLQGMDRANLLLGSRPLDRVKAITGFSAGVNDAGSMAIALMRSADGSLARLFIVPVTDADSFLRANFTSTGGNAYTLLNGKKVHAHALGSHVAISENEQAIQSLATGVAPSPATELDDHTAAVASQGDAFVLIRRELILAAIAHIQNRASNQQSLAALAAIPLSVAGDIESIVLSLDFDPLALIVRSFAKVKPDSRAARVFSQKTPADSNLNLLHLPNKPFYASGSFNLRNVGDDKALEEIWREAGLKLPPALLTSIDQIEFAAYPSTAGVAGGLLNDAVAVLTSSRSEDVVASVRDCVLEQKSDEPVRRDAGWVDDQKVTDSLNAAAYEVTTIDVPPELLHYQVIEQLLVGRAGFRGYIKQREQDVVITFSQRPATLKAAMNVVAAKDNQSSLANQPVLRSMRRWLPRHLVVEGYINLGQLSEFMKAVQASSMLGVMKLPHFDQSLPPIAIGAGAAEGGAEHSVIIPAGVLATIADFVMAQMPSQGLPAEELEE